MKKSGFTLVELLGVIVVLAIISTIAVGVYTNVFDKQKETAYENKAELIELSAEKWATELNISKSTTITVTKLINDSYYQADDVKDNEAIVNDPRDNSSLLCNTISITIENGSAVATLNEEKDCELKEVEVDSAKVRILAYEYNNGKVIKNIRTAEDTSPELPWTSKSVLLVVEPEDEYNKYSKVTFSNGDINEEKIVSDNNIIKSSDITDGQEINPASYANAYLVDTSLFLVTDYSVSINVVDVGVKNNYVTVKIDKESPTLTVSMNNAWTTGNKIATLRGSDGTGSGLKGFYVSSSETDYSTSELITTTYEATKEMEDIGDYYAFAVDNVDNVSTKGTKFNVSNIDKVIPSCSISIVEETAFKTDPDSDWYTKDVQIKFTTNVAGGTGLSYKYGTDLSNEQSFVAGTLQEGQSKTITTNLTTNAIHNYYGYVVNSLGVEDKCELTVKIDKVDPSISPKSNPITYNSGMLGYTIESQFYQSVGISGKRSVVCTVDGIEVKKIGDLGTYTRKIVICTLTSGSGKKATTTTGIPFRFSYPCTSVYHHQTCEGTTYSKCGCHYVFTSHQNDHTGDVASICHDHCECGGSECIHHYSYDCSYTTYHCYSGGTLSGLTCYF